MLFPNSPPSKTRRSPGAKALASARARGSEKKRPREASGRFFFFSGARVKPWVLGRLGKRFLEKGRSGNTKTEVEKLGSCALLPASSPQSAPTPFWPGQWPTGIMWANPGLKNAGLRLVDKPHTLGQQKDKPRIQIYSLFFILVKGKNVRYYQTLTQDGGPVLCRSCLRLVSKGEPKVNPWTDSYFEQHPSGELQTIQGLAFHTGICTFSVAQIFTPSDPQLQEFPKGFLGWEYLNLIYEGNLFE